jgi:hypothetical protein
MEGVIHISIIEEEEEEKLLELGELIHPNANHPCTSHA